MLLWISVVIDSYSIRGEYIERPNSGMAEMHKGKPVLLGKWPASQLDPFLFKVQLLNPSLNVAAMSRRYEGLQARWNTVAGLNVS